MSSTGALEYIAPPGTWNSEETNCFRFARKCLRSSAGHLTEQSRALRTSSLWRHGLGRRVSGGGRSSVGSSRANLLRSRLGSSSGRARRSAADGSLTRHYGCCVVEVLVRGLVMRCQVLKNKVQDVEL